MGFAHPTDVDPGDRGAAGYAVFHDGDVNAPCGGPDDADAEQGA